MSPYETLIWVFLKEEEKKKTHTTENSSDYRREQIKIIDLILKRGRGGGNRTSDSYHGVGLLCEKCFSVQ